MCESIKRGDVGELKEIMEKSINLGMKTFDVALFELYKAGRITMEEALRNADSANNLRLKINLSEGEGASASAQRGSEESLDGLSLVNDEPVEEETASPAENFSNKASFSLAE